MSKKSDIERRAFKIEVRENGNGARVLAGTPIVYDKKSEDMGFYEYIGRGAAKDAIKSSDPRLLYGHNSDVLLPIARKKSGTLREIEDKYGVYIEADPPKKNQFVDALIESIERGDVGEMSFGFTVLDDEWEGLDTDKPKRTIRKIGEIFDYSYVAFAAYNDTSVALRSLDAAKKEETKETKTSPFMKLPPTEEEYNRSIKPQEPEERLTITTETEQFEFTGSERFTEAAEKIRSLANPTIPADDITEPDPTIIQDSEVKDDTLEKIKEKIKRYSK